MRKKKRTRCTGICVKYKSPNQAVASMYRLNKKLCRHCDNIVLEFDGIKCPCCGFKMRLGPRENPKLWKSDKKLLPYMKVSTSSPNLVTFEVPGKKTQTADLEKGTCTCEVFIYKNNSNCQHLRTAKLYRDGSRGDTL